jgi:hypothetical protein
MGIPTVIILRFCIAIRSGRATSEYLTQDVSDWTLKPCILFSYSDSWCSKHFLHAKGMRKAREVRSQLLDIMKMEKLDIIPCGTDWDKIRYVLIYSLLLASSSAES